MKLMLRLVVLAILVFLLCFRSWPGRRSILCAESTSHQELLHLHELLFDLLRGGRPGPVRRYGHGRGPLFPQRGRGLRVEGPHCTCLEERGAP